jgi:AcrR family transcriptional regulator
MLDFPKINISINEKVYLKNPESSSLGLNILSHSIDMIHQLGIDAFTFGKLSRKMGSPEASIYRYFENKHKLLLYLTSWYYTWLEYKVAFATVNIEDERKQLDRAIRTLCSPSANAEEFSHINKEKLHQIVISESAKAYLTNAVDEDNKEGAFKDYKNLVKRVANLIRKVKPTYKYPEMLVSTLIEGAHLQNYFATHLPSLTNSYKKEDSVTNFFTELVFNSIKTK